jgi:HAMP domain-containing protein
MKLKTRIIVGFVAVILVPLILFSASLYGFSQTQARHMQESSSQTSDSDEMVYDISLAQSSSSQVRLMAKDMILTATIILVFTALSVGLWIYRSIAVPLVKLRKATRNIKEGNLDFVLEVEGNDEFSQLCQDFEEMRKRLKESTEEKILMDKENKELISNISHDLKTPITAVKGYVEGIMDGVADTPEKMDRYVRTIYNKTNEMDHLINFISQIFPQNMQDKNISFFHLIQISKKFCTGKSSVCCQNCMCTFSSDRKTGSFHMPYTFLKNCFAQAMIDCKFCIDLRNLNASHKASSIWIKYLVIRLGQHIIILFPKSIYNRIHRMFCIILFRLIPQFLIFIIRKICYCFIISAD